MKEVDLSVLGKENPFDLIGEQWMLITAGDKVKEAGLKPVALEDGPITFEQAFLTLTCRKLFKSDMKQADFIDKDVFSKWYSDAGLHSVYVLEIEKLLERQYELASLA